MSKSTLILIGSLGAIAIIAGAVYSGVLIERGRITNTPLIVTQEIVPDSIKDALLFAREENTNLQAALDRMMELNDIDIPAIATHDTLWRDVPYTFFTTDSVLELRGVATTTDAEDTVVQEYTTNVHMNMAFYPPPIKRFFVRNLSVDPLKLKFTRRSVIMKEDALDFPISCDIVAGFGHSLAGGAFLNYGDWGVGVEFIADEKPLYLIKKRFVF